jgi:hypothetical protein
VPIWDNFVAAASFHATRSGGNAGLRYGGILPMVTRKKVIGLSYPPLIQQDAIDLKHGGGKYEGQLFFHGRLVKL